MSGKLVGECRVGAADRRSDSLPLPYVTAQVAVPAERPIRMSTGASPMVRVSSALQLQRSRIFKYCFGRWLAFRYIVAANYHCEVMCYAEHVDVFVERGVAAAAGYGHSEAAAVEMAEGGQYARKTFD